MYLDNPTLGLSDIDVRTFHEDWVRLSDLDYTGKSIAKRLL